MTLQSMTSYGYGEVQTGPVTYVCEIRTLNSRYLEVNVRMPRSLLALEIDLINHVKATLRRGKVDVFVDTAKTGASKDLPTLDPEAVKHYAQILAGTKDILRAQAGLNVKTDDLDLARFLALEGVLVGTDARGRSGRSHDAVDSHREPLFKALNQALDGVGQARRKEGQSLGSALLDLLQALESGRAEVAKHHGEIMAHLHKTYVKRLEAFLATLAKQGLDRGGTALPSDERLVTEVALLSDKSDIDEELTRLATHISEFKRLMASDEGSGRKLDFLCQEMHREVNTMSNKLVQTDVSQHTIEMKQTVERIRQQVQNIRMMALDTSDIKTDARVYVVSAPSGTGKTTLNRRLVQEHETVQMSVSYTARAKRKGETDGVHYHYVTADEFKARIEHGEMLEYAEVFGNFYGTSLAEIHRIQALGKVPLLEIDVQGWSWARKRLTNAVALFIVPPSIEALWSRLEKRNTEPLDVRWRRLKTARAEIELGHIYDYFIINESVDTAYDELQSIVINGNSGSIGNAQGRQLCAALLKEFDEAPWLKQLSQRFADII